jgi:4'-phosphopantetheinyl transferase
MAEKHNLKQGEIHIYCTTVSANADRTDALRKTLSADESARADRNRFELGRQTYIIARGLLRMCLGNYLGQDPRALTFGYTQLGKPYLKNVPDGKTDIHFNVSHSHGGILLGFSRDGEIGVDIEKIRERESFEEIAQRFFAKREWDELQALGKGQRLSGFFRCWTRKEAFIKACGQGLSYPLKKFIVPVEPKAPHMRMEMLGEENDLCAWSLFDIEAPQEYVAACAVRAKNFAIQQCDAAELPALHYSPI